MRKQSSGILKAIRSDSQRGMFCLDWNDDDPIEIRGSDIDDDYIRFEINLVPCNYLHTMLGYQDDKIDPSCVGDLQE